jgi:hypothetical protein
MCHLGTTHAVKSMLLGVEHCGARSR